MPGSPTLGLMFEGRYTYSIDKNLKRVQRVDRGASDWFGITTTAARDGNQWTLFDQDGGTSVVRKTNPSTGAVPTGGVVNIETLVGNRQSAFGGGSKCFVEGLCGWGITIERATGQLVAVKIATVADGLTPTNPDVTAPPDTTLGKIVKRWNLFLDRLDCAINSAGTRLMYCDGGKVKIYDLVADRDVRTIVDLGADAWWPLWLGTSFIVTPGGYLRDDALYRFDLTGRQLNRYTYPGWDHVGDAETFNDGIEGIAFGVNSDDACLPPEKQGPLLYLVGADPDFGSDGTPLILPIRILTGEVLPAVSLRPDTEGTDEDEAAGFTPLGQAAFANSDGTVQGTPKPPDEPPEPGERGECPPPGPGGSSFDGAPQGDRRVQPGGYPPTYVQPTGEGTVPSADDPDDPQPLDTIRVPLISCDLKVCDGTTYRLAKSPFPRPGEPQCDARVIRWPEVPYPSADRFGSLPSQTCEVEIADEDGKFRAMLATGANRFYKRWTADLYAEDNDARLAGTPRQRLARGRCITVRTGEQDQSLVLVFSDEYSRHDSPYSLDRMLPAELLGDIFADGASSPDLSVVPHASEQLASQAATMLLGEASDEYRAAENPPVIPIGICKLHFLNTVLLGGEKWHAYFLCKYAVQGVPALFGSNLDLDCPASVRLDPALYDGSQDPDFLVPGYAPWDAYFSNRYITIVRNGVTYWVTMIFGRGPISEQHVNQKVPLSANVNGGEDVGDGSGTLIDDISRIVQWLLDRVFQKTTSGVWGDVARFTDGIAMIRTSDIEAIRLIHNARLSTRYRGAIIIDQQRAARDWLADICVSAGIQPGINHHGQITFRALDASSTLTGLRTFTDLAHIRDGSFKVTSELNAELENALPWEAGPEPASGRLTVPKSTLTADDSIDNWGDTYTAQPITFVALHRPDVAGSVAAFRLLWTQDGITRGSFDIDLAGGSLRAGELINVTHLAGIGQTGWRRRLLQVTDRTLVVDDAETSTGWTTRVGWEDAEPVLGNADRPAIGFHPLRSEGDDDAWILGSEVAGTAYKLG